MFLKITKEAATDKVLSFTFTETETLPQNTTPLILTTPILRGQFIAEIARIYPIVRIVATDDDATHETFMVF